MNLPVHLAIIMDGNGRWARRRRHPRVYGHIRGSQRVRPIVEECARLGIKYLTLYAFSEENWGRPREEVNFLMRLLRRYLTREQKVLMKNDIRFVAIGDKEKLPAEARAIVEETVRMTAKNKGLQLTFALSYGGRQEILRGISRIASDAVTGKIDLHNLDENMFERYLYTADIPDPDLIIRTSGEYRLSNFLLWQMAYAELYFTEKYWPEFDLNEFHKALASFSLRTRRYGRVNEPLAVVGATTASNDPSGALH